MEGTEWDGREGGWEVTDAVRGRRDVIGTG
jgi:hypothetical protein